MMEAQHVCVCVYECEILGHHDFVAEGPFTELGLLIFLDLLKETLTRFSYQHVPHWSAIRTQSKGDKERLILQDLQERVPGNWGQGHTHTHTVCVVL